MLALAVIIILTILRRWLDSIEPEHPRVDHHVTRTLRRCYVGYMEGVLVKTLYRDGKHASQSYPIPALITLWQEYIFTASSWVSMDDPPLADACMDVYAGFTIVNVLVMLFGPVSGLTVPRLA